MVRYLRPAALSAAALVLLLATDGTAAQSADLALTAARVGTLPPRPAAPAPARAPGAVPAAFLPSATVLADPGRALLRAVPHELFTGPGFDACSAPPLEAMRAWHGSSPFGAVGIYTSGRQRACGQAQLTADWVRQVRALGWRLLPTHVGLQAPCSNNPRKPQKIDPANAVQQGRDEAAEAVRGAQAVGLGPGSPVYLDMEAYPPGDPVCAKAVVDFTLGWTQALHGAGYWSGFYSSVDSGVADLVSAVRAGAAPAPDALWYARWDGRDTTDGSGAVPDDMWTGHQRIHQYLGEVHETYGGVGLDIDRDELDAVVAR
ncbi:hypothetical protein P3T37_002221 [Kitasatospora sp. MAA4]|uniref:DUF1906 domain-containing protein n=1 Tax=Kitasatospora sp. MAA4 TaxID=3035093 RepID=UPI002473D6CB|nr:DUF1906 domain-containing protein [Kitasatospora sp. MAA4]MDH6132835.1 hypothetical protein [Kitasatospora sp. MAA4]